MKVIDVLTAPWAIVPEMYQTILGAYDRWIQGETANFSALEAALGRPLKNEPKPYQVIDGVAVIPVDGVLAKRMNMMMDISGGTSTELLGADFREALARSDVKAILLDINSPGGAVDGTIELAREVFSARGTKPIIALGDGMIASAAMWIGAATDEVYLTGEATTAGSIGVITTHTDVSRAQEMEGVKTTVITAGKYKAIANQYEPLGAEGRQNIQERLDYIYTLFVQDMASFRGSDVATVLANMADGRVFMGRQAVEAGLVDGIMSREQVMKRLTGASTSSATGKAMYKPGESAQKTGGVKMEGLTMEALRAEHPELVQALVEEGRLAGIATGAEAERARIQAVEAQALSGHEALIAGLKYDGKTSGPEAAVQVLQAEKANSAKLLKTLEAEAVQPADQSMEAAGTESAKTPEEQWKADWAKDAKLRAEFQDNEATYLAFQKANAAGLLKIFGKK